MINNCCNPVQGAWSFEFNKKKSSRKGAKPQRIRKEKTRVKMAPCTLGFSVMMTIEFYRQFLPNRSQKLLGFHLMSSFSSSRTLCVPLRLCGFA